MSLIEKYKKDIEENGIEYFTGKSGREQINLINAESVECILEHFMDNLYIGFDDKSKEIYLSNDTTKREKKLNLEEEVFDLLGIYEDSSDDWEDQHEDLAVYFEQLAAKIRVSMVDKK